MSIQYFGLSFPNHNYSIYRILGTRYFQNLEEESSGFFVFVPIRVTIVELDNLDELEDLGQLVNLVTYFCDTRSGGVLFDL